MSTMRQLSEWSANLLLPDTNVDTEDPFMVRAELTRNAPPPAPTPGDKEFHLRLNGTIIATLARRAMDQGETITMEAEVDPLFGPVVEGTNTVTFTGWEMEDPVVAGTFLAVKPPSVVTSLTVSKDNVVAGELFRASVVHEGRVEQGIVDATIVFNRVETNDQGEIIDETTILSDDIQTTFGVNSDEFVLQLKAEGSPDVCAFLTDRRVIEFP